MSLIQIRGLGVASPRVLFQNLDLTIHAADRIGLIAGNGMGKTTLLRCLARQAEPGSGGIVTSRGLRVGFVEQDVPPHLLDLPMTEAIRRALPAPEWEANGWKTGLVLDMMDTPAAMRQRRLSELSGGWQRLALIARAWINDPNVLLPDEPTNHLDLERLALLESWINHAAEGVAMVIASHDRAFLDNCTNRTLFLRPDECRTYAHPFSRARDLLAADDAAHEAKLERDAKEAGRLRRNAGQLRNVGINSGSDLLLKKAKYLVNRAAAIEEAAKPLVKVRAGEIRLSNKGTHAKVLVSLDNVAVSAPTGQPLFRTGTLKLFQGDRLVIGGGNGTGKSCFAGLLRRAMLDRDDVPGISVAPSVTAGYLDQRMSTLPAAETPHAFIAGRFRPGDRQAVRLLASAGFDIDTQRRPIAALSLGQKTRLGLLALRLT